MRIINEIKITEASAPVFSDIYINSACDLLTVQTFGSASAMKILIQGRTNSETEDWKNLAFFNVADYEMTKGDTGITAAGVYSVSVVGISQIRLNVAEVTGTVNVTASFANTSDD